MDSQTTITFTKFRETKNTIRYQENGHENTHIIGPLYVKKTYLGSPIPENITITIKKGEDNS